jgi:hypothetical protein
VDVNQVPRIAGVLAFRPIPHVDERASSPAHLTPMQRQIACEWAATIKMMVYQRSC